MTGPASVVVRAMPATAVAVVGAAPVIVAVPVVSIREVPRLDVDRGRGGHVLRGVREAGLVGEEHGAVLLDHVVVPPVRNGGSRGDARAFGGDLVRLAGDGCLRPGP